MKAIASKTFSYKARMVKQGDIFEVDAQDADNLMNWNLIEKIEKKAAKTKEEKATKKTK